MQRLQCQLYPAFAQISGSRKLTVDIPIRGTCPASQLAQNGHERVEWSVPILDKVCGTTDGHGMLTDMRRERLVRTLHTARQVMCVRASGKTGWRRGNVWDGHCCLAQNEERVQLGGRVRPELNC